MTNWVDLQAELDAWGAAGLTATFWWRDDDAEQPGPVLDRLFALSARHAAPLALAVVPARASAFDLPRGVQVVQHGHAHDNRAAPAEKKCEFPATRPLADGIAAIADGWQRLRDLFGAAAIPLFVPPWNRIAPAYLPALPAIGMRGISTYGARKQADEAGLRVVNTHIDPIDWRGARGFAGDAVALALAVTHLQARRQGQADAAEPTGLLTHHLAHDEASWTFVDRFLAEVAGHGAARLLPADAALAT